VATVSVHRKAVKSRARPALNRDRVVQSAIALADQGDINALSMRRLAQELSVEAMSLYHYFPSKEALLGAMIDTIYAEMELPPETPDWRSDMRTCAMSAKETFLRHRWAAPLVGEMVTPFGARFAWMNGVLGRLRTAGFSANMTHHAYHALDSHIVGYVLWALPYLAATQELPDAAREFVESPQLADLPYLVEHIQEHIADRSGEVSEFEFGLGLILDGLERVRADA
jgi:AcrR family transcriptional regulator